MVVRYMGTKRHIVADVVAAIDSARMPGRVIDLFSGMGSVAEALSATASVVTNDSLQFTASIARARFTGEARVTRVSEVLSELGPVFEERRAALSRRFELRVISEQTALSGSRVEFVEFMSRVKHVGNSSEMRAAAENAATAADDSRYCLASLYFSGGYFSLEQAIAIDASRCAIEAHPDRELRDWLLSAWLSAMSVLVNAPGHTAQYLKPSTPEMHARIVRAWRRDYWSAFKVALGSTAQIGTDDWRANNTVIVGDALAALRQGIPDLGAIYADPPYTKDQYTRYYHVYETLYKYDFPDSYGVGRNRSDRISTGFSVKSQVTTAFRELFEWSSRSQVPLIVSYPTGGLLQQAGSSVIEIGADYYSTVEVSSIEVGHSTLGASKGSQRKVATENLFVFSS